MEHFPHRREFTRIPIKILGWVEIGDRTISGPAKDVSMKGVYLETDQECLVGSKGQVRLSFMENQADLPIEVEGRVVRSDSSGIGVEFVEMGVESYHHLRNLVLYHSRGESTEQIEEELESHLGLKKNR